MSYLSFYVTVLVFSQSIIKPKLEDSKEGQEARLVFLLGQGREEKRGWLGPRKVRYHWKSGGG